MSVSFSICWTKPACSWFMAPVLVVRKMRDISAWCISPMKQLWILHFMRLAVSWRVSVMERSFAITVTGNDVAVAEKLVLVSCQALETDRPTRVELTGADSQLCAQAIAKAISKARRGIVKDPCGVDP